MINRPTLLLVDDDVTLLHATAQLLDLSGFDAILSDTSIEALTLLADTSVSGVLIDIFMPDRDGVETISEMRSRWPDLPIIAMSGGWRAIKAEQALAMAEGLGANAILSKPFDRQALLAALAQAGLA
ncbi:MAG: response regulator [Caulobacteraceae bacterium]|nr:response regulator [Caulobacteraceae bacterium]